MPLPVTPIRFDAALWLFIFGTLRYSVDPASSASMAVPSVGAAGAGALSVFFSSALAATFGAALAAALAVVVSSFLSGPGLALSVAAVASGLAVAVSLVLSVSGLGLGVRLVGLGLGLGAGLGTGRDLRRDLRPGFCGGLAVDLGNGRAIRVGVVLVVSLVFGGLGLVRGGDGHVHRPALHQWRSLDDTVILDPLGEALEERPAELRMSHLASAELDRDLEPIAVLQELDRPMDLGVEVADPDLRAKANLLELDRS